MSERFSKNENEKKRKRNTNSAVFGCIGSVVFPIIGTAITKTEIAANHPAAISNAGFVFSIFLIPLVFFGVYKLDRLVEKKVPKTERDGEFADGEAEVLQR